MCTVRRQSLVHGPSYSVDKTDLLTSRESGLIIKQVFGNINGEHWIGNNKIYGLTNQASYKLRIDLEKFDGSTTYAEYDSFWIEDENSNYTLHLGQYSGTVGDRMKAQHNNALDGQPFTTFDRDNDSWGGNCAREYRGPWWYKECALSHLNSMYYPQEEGHWDGIVWPTWNSWYTLKSFIMKIQKYD
uniref:Fibrinogen-like protein 1-like n=1 Tax=Saccoglossus kowalevskii TaxID=10224 RepID=A0ABM0MJL2_SACKO|nr:PREDICTED: fibrinogen-like protein 1-like [Saccoglossus kowalevskii]